MKTLMGIRWRLSYPALLVWLLCTQPLFVLVIKGWSSGALILGGVACLLMIIIEKRKRPPRSVVPSNDWPHHAFVVSFSLFFVAIAFSGLLRNDLHIANLDSPARFLLAIPIFLLIRQIKTDVIKPLSLCIVLGLLFTLADQIFFPSDRAWSRDRMSNHFADPLAFGYIALAFALSTLAFITCSKHKPYWLLGLTVAACCSGIYISVMTASRTGWLAIPLCLVFLAYVNRKHLSKKSVMIGLGLVIGAALIAYNTSATINERVNATTSNITGYSFQGIAPDTSVGMRITFLRIAYDMLAEKPLLGYGDTQRRKPDVPEKIKTYASPYTVDFSLSSGFHNEIVTNAIQYGLIAGITAALLFFTPLAIYWRALATDEESRRTAAVIGIVFTLTYLVSSLSTEVFGLKYTTSLYALTTALLCGVATRNKPTST